MEFTQKPTCRIFCKTDPSFALAIKNGNLILAPLNPNNESQFWYKEFTNTPVLDADGVRSFVLLNKFTDQAIKRRAQDQPLSVVPYDTKVVDTSLFWNEASDSNDGFKAIRPINDVNLCLDAQHADKNVVDGTCVVLWTRNRQNNQWWKIEEFPLPSKLPTYKITNLVNSNFSLTIRDGKVALATPNANDAFQHWYKKDGANDGEFTQFALINKATGQVIQRSTQLEKVPVRLIPFYANIITERTILWNYKEERRGNGCIRNRDGSSQHWYPQGGQVKDGRDLQTKEWDNSDVMCWKITPY